MNTCPCALSHFLTPTLTKDQASALPTELPSERTWGRKTLKGRTLHLHGSFPSAETPSSLSPPMRGPSDPVIYRTDSEQHDAPPPAIMKRAVCAFSASMPIHSEIQPMDGNTFVSCHVGGWNVGSVGKNTDCPFREPLSQRLHGVPPTTLKTQLREFHTLYGS